MSSAVVVFESTDGSSRQVADSIGAGLGERTRVAAVDEIDAAEIPADALLVVGGSADIPPALRAWIASLEGAGRPAAAFVIQPGSPEADSASHSLSKRLRRRGCGIVAEPESFAACELDRAHAWGKELARRMDPTRQAVRLD